MLKGLPQRKMAARCNSRRRHPLKKTGSADRPKGLSIRTRPLENGADGRIRTAYLLITNQLLYQLSYAGIIKKLLCL